jgi:hypothetical protein
MRLTHGLLKLYFFRLRHPCLNDDHKIVVVCLDNTTKDKNLCME